ncbi:phosphoribosylaminoimidazole-succinocarboxamide synthase [Bacteroidota bacterium]|nr:phosphoribosylaminoimidazole-succinocarboxamide synthase [Bacteroidota bacterium]
MSAIYQTNFQFPKQTKFYRGKVRDVYTIDNKFLVMVASDRISAFDVILPKPIPCKGQVLNQVATHFLNLTKDIVPNWLLATPDANVAIGKMCEPFKVEMVIRGYVTGHAAREYKLGKRQICGVPMPDGMNENDKFPEPIITPTTKAEEGHDEDISREEIISSGLVSESDYVQLENYTRALFKFGSEEANRRGLILVDTKYEFGMADGKIYLIDEIHTPDSSRYFYSDGYKEKQSSGEPQKQLSKEFVREWLIENNFMGKEGQQIPEMPEEFVQTVTNRYIELFEQITGKKFQPDTSSNPEERIRKNISEWIDQNV